MYVCVCERKPPDTTKEVIEFAGQHVIIPFSNSQAHRIAEKYECNKYYVEDITALKQLLEALRKYINRKYEIIEINDIRWYPHVVEYVEVLEDSDDYYVEYYSDEDGDGYYAKHKRRNIEVNITDILF